MGRDAQDQQQGRRHGGEQQDQPDEGQPGGDPYGLGFDAPPRDQAVQGDRAYEGSGGAGAEDDGDDVDDLVGVGQVVVLRGEHHGEQEAEQDLYACLRDADLLDEFAPHAVRALFLGLVAACPSLRVDHALRVSGD